jgi:hypothetical protein
MFIWCGYKSGFFLLRRTHAAEIVNVERLATRRNVGRIWIDGCKIRCFEQYNEQHTYCPYPVTTEAQMCVTFESKQMRLKFRIWRICFVFHVFCRSFALHLVPAVLCCAMGCLTKQKAVLPRTWLYVGNKHYAVIHSSKPYLILPRCGMWNP